MLNAAPYAGGVLAKGTSAHKRYVYQEASAEMLAPVARVEEICARYDIPPGAAAPAVLDARSPRRLDNLRHQQTGTHRPDDRVEPPSHPASRMGRVDGTAV